MMKLFGVIGAVTVFDTVKACKVRACFSGCYGIVGGDSIINKTKVKLFQDCSLGFQCFCGSKDGGFYLTVESVITSYSIHYTKLYDILWYSQR